MILSHRAISILPLGSGTWNCWVLVFRHHCIQGGCRGELTTPSFLLTFSCWGTKFKLEYDQFAWIVFSSKYHNREGSSFLLHHEINTIPPTIPPNKYLRGTYMLGSSWYSGKPGWTKIDMKYKSLQLRNSLGNDNP